MLKRFDMIFYKGKTPISKAIRFLTKSEYSHCAILLDSMHLIQLDWNTPTSIKHIDYHIQDYDVYELTIDLSKDEEQKIIEYIIQRISTEYDFVFIISRFFNILFGTKIYNSKDKYNCDELIVEAFRSIGINLIDGDVKLSPSELAKSKLLKKIN